MLSLVGEVIGLLELNELSYGLMSALREAVPCEFCAMHELPADLPHTVSLTDPPVPPEIHDALRATHRRTRSRSPSCARATVVLHGSPI